MPETKLGKKIKDLLYLKRISQAELSRITGIHKQVLSNWITGFRKPKYENLQKLAKALGTTTEDLLDGHSCADTDCEENILQPKQINETKIKDLEKKLRFKNEQIKHLKERIVFLEDEVSFYKENS